MHTFASKTDVSINEQRIKSSLNAAGMFALKVISDTLQGQIWSVVKAKSKKKYVVKTASKSLHDAGAAMVDGKAFAIDEDILKEARILKYLQSLPQCPASIIAYQASFCSEHHYFLLMEDGGNSLFDFVQRAHYFLQMKSIEPANWMQVVRCVFKQMVQAVAFLHAHHVIHYDISIENFTLSKDPRIAIENLDTEHEKISFINIEQELQIKLIDFGLAERFIVDEHEQKPSSVSTKFVGKRNYQCPEIREGKAFDAAANDIWCLGVCLFMMATGSHPWEVAEKSDTNFKLIYKHNRLKHVLNVWNRAQYVDDDLLHLMQSMFKPQSDRISMAQIQSHAWLSGDDVEHAEMKQ